ncbi:MAG: PIN domain-containing protein [Ilumatobacteraceae bacterium]
MSGSQTTVMGDRGRLVVPSELRRAAHAGAAQANGASWSRGRSISSPTSSLIVVERPPTRTQHQEREGLGFLSSARLAAGGGRADVVEAALEGSSCCSAASWSEVAQRISAWGRDESLSRALLQRFDLVVESVTEVDAEWAAVRWRHGETLSIGGRLCVAVGERMDATVLTADKAWGAWGRITQIR